jgi:hypothetical protein
MKRGECLPGCKNEREPHHVCCLTHWKTVPRALKVELWSATKAAETGRGAKNNGKMTSRSREAFQNIIVYLLKANP